MADDWMDRALRELGEHLLDRDIPERLRRVVRAKEEGDPHTRDCSRGESTE